MVSKITEIQTNDGEITLGELIRFLMSTPEFKVKQLSDTFLSLTEHTHDIENINGADKLVKRDEFKSAMDEFDNAIADALNDLEKRIDVPFLLAQLKVLQQKPDFDASKIENRLKELEQRKPENKTTVVQNFDKARIDKIEKKQGEVVTLLGKIIDDADLKVDELRKEIAAEIARKIQKDGQHVNIIGGVGGVNKLKLLFDVNVENVTNGQTIAWNATTQKWEPSSGGAVDSVNGQTGVVVLDASDVGAVPYTGATSNVDLGTHDLITDTITSKSSSGLILENASGGDVLHIGAGGGVNATAYGGWNFDGATANKMTYFGGTKTLSSLAAADIATSGTHITITAQSATDKPLVVKGAASQTANLLEAQNSSGTAFLTVGPPTLTGSSTTSNFLNLTATMPTTMTDVTHGVFFNIASAGSSSQVNRAMTINYTPGYTGSSECTALSAGNTSAGTGATYAGGGANVYRVSAGNFGGVFLQNASTTGINVGSRHHVVGSSVANYGSWHSASSTTNAPALNVGLMSVAYGATTNVAGAFMLRNTGTPSFTSTALLVDNGDQAVPVAVFRDNGTAVFTIADGGAVTAAGDITVPDEAYGAGWNGSLEVPTKNAIYDKIETMTAGSGITIGQALALNQTLTSYI